MKFFHRENLERYMSTLRGARAKAANPEPLPAGIGVPMTLPPSIAASAANTRLQKAVAGIAAGQGTGAIGVMHPAIKGVDTQDVTRLRSFIERYVIERAALFRADHESEDGWRAILDGKRMYTQIAYTSKQIIKEDI
jgi:hypothetical protein